MRMKFYTIAVEWYWQGSELLIGSCKIVRAMRSARLRKLAHPPHGADHYIPVPAASSRLK
jgi:hypothetical protein